MDNTARWHILFTGRVQHVGFRYTALYFSKGLYLTGWVRNNLDGSVEMEAQGSVSCLRNFVIKMKSQSHIHITDVKITEIEIVPAERKFRVLEDEEYIY